MKIRLVGAELFEVDGRMDRHDEAGSRVSQFCEKHLNHCIFPHSVLTSLTIPTDSTNYVRRQHLIGVPEGRSLLTMRKGPGICIDVIWMRLSRRAVI
jgi:hypothetical protein